MKKTLKKWMPLLGAVPLIAGAVGYAFSGLKVSDSFYASFALYFTNPISEAYNGWIEFARWTAPLVTATAILCALRTVWDRVSWQIKCLGRDSVAVYSDVPCEIKFEGKVKAVYPGKRFMGNAKSHIILFSTDEETLHFYEEHREKIKGKQVYLCLRELESALVDIQSPNVLCFDLSGGIARNLWKEIRLWSRKSKKMDLVIWGDGRLAEEVLSRGLLFNLFSSKQHLVYHVISEKGMFQIKHPHLSLDNRDEIRYYDPADREIWKVIKKADIVIGAAEMDTQTLQALAVNCGEGELYYYSPRRGKAGDYISHGRVKPFGRETDFLTDENIRRQKLEESAMKLNAQYARQYGGMENAAVDERKIWNELSGFLKNSNISAADYKEVLSALPVAADEWELAELEHIRWCRFHYLNYWKYGEPENGARKDNLRRIHRNLVPFEKLTEEEKGKDLDVVRAARNRDAYADLDVTQNGEP